MRINAINNYNTTPFMADGKKNNSMKNAAKAVILATAMSAAAPSCSDMTKIEHNHFVPLPTDTFTKQELTPTPLPPQIIFVENEVPGKNDTIILHDTIPQIVEKTDTIYKTDTIKVPEIIVDKDTIWKTDTIKVPEYITKYDTIFKTVHDTIIQPGEPIIKHDTITLPGETIYVKEDWKSPVPPKQEEMYDRLGIETTGDGKFFLSMSYYDRKNSVLVTRQLNGLASSRDGKILVYNVIKTGWDHEAEGVTLGKNETFEKQLVYLSEDGTELGMKVMKPKVDIKVSNGNKRPNWSVFEKGTLSTPDAWTDETSFFATSKGGVIELSNGFKLKPGMTKQSVTTVNPYNSEWELIEWNVVKGDPD